MTAQTKWGEVTGLIAAPSASGAIVSGGSFELLSRISDLNVVASASQQQRSQAVELEYSTYLGGTSEGYWPNLAIDASGSAYVVGRTHSTDFPTQNPFQSDTTGRDVVVTKLSSSGSSAIYSTYLGGIGSEEGYGIAVDASGNAILTGNTYSADFPTMNSLQSYATFGDAFVTKLNSSGNALIFSTYLGGGSNEFGHAIDLDTAGNVYVTGQTSSADFPTVNPYQTDAALNDAFVFKLDSSGSALVYSTYLSGSSAEYGNGIAVDEAGNAYVTGYTQSTDFPTENAFQDEIVAGQDVFVTKLNASGDALVYSTYLGGSGNDIGYSIAVDQSGNAYITGEVVSSDFPTQSPYQDYGGNQDAFVTKLNGSGNALIYSTYLGGSSLDYGRGIVVDAAGSAIVLGYTSSNNFPTADPYQASLLGIDLYLTKLTAAGDELVWSTYFGGSSSEYCSGGRGIAIDGAGNIYISGETNSTNYPTMSPYQTDQGGRDLFVTKLSSSGSIACGDADGSGGVNITDAVYLVNYIFASGPAPLDATAGDNDCSGACNITDAVYLVNYIFASGPAPCAGCL